ncbi:MAG: hypothetical protein A2750_01425 [Candidatus Yanofskybacteria bacterium RIFCSPHIGHO2_01_FULL_45_42]|uniref:Uncharacterized protein n=2 Tax=Parcubacteria group TaxID=1794811 RepID=A0A1G1ZR51_9BACT|nr:MAG: hypothetical protein A2750_01425 [Candidatus Yanofskybacteria bacterium RIFCSPHIGHO2_01_FULL_45_42]OGY63882.1 MAG: hypothetical protein A3J53_03605 [Candidatus Harrisonbacteria bacterium RIFCSPHIGHO2_02_FULL_40_20]OGY66971.1 MAG: hypothetical protein A3I24_00655 [Candidatus Harrisonbacteria bacterium RIFCSPLOWO2_02_FULL_41_13b]
MNVTYAAEAQAAVKTMSGWQKLQMRRGKKVYLGHEQREGWTEKLPFYLFWCEDCKYFAKDYTHGYIEKQSLICSHCGLRYDFTPWWVSWVQLWQALKLSFQIRFSDKYNRKPPQ